MWTIKYSKQAAKDTKKIEQSNLKQNVINLIEILKINPFQNPPPYEKLVGDLTDCLKINKFLENDKLNMSTIKN